VRSCQAFKQQRRRARDEEPHVARRHFREARLGKQAHVQRGHAHEHRGFGHFLDDKFRVEFAEPDHLAAVEQRAVQRDKEAMHVEDRQSVDEDVAALRQRFARIAPAPIVLQHLRVAEHIAVCQHRTFAAPGGAAGIENGRQVVWLIA
jgi:hypothetical protein